MIKRLKKYTHYEKGVEKMLNKMDEKIKLWALRANACGSFKSSDAFNMLAKKPNANILLKNKEICNQVVNRLGSRLYELVYSSNRFYSRLDAFFITNTLLDSKNSILMIDEIDDIFNEKTPKALIKRILSENALPTFWLSDECEFSKYFDMVVG